MVDHQQDHALLELLEPSLASSGLDVEGLEVSTAGRRRLVKILVDKDGGVTLDEIAAATRLVSSRLDESEAFADVPYTLEVTSPGVDRPLSAPRHWRRNLDRLVKVRPHDGAEFIGRIVGADEDAATVDVDGVFRSVAYSAVAKATVEIEFNRPRAHERSSPTGKE